MKKNTKLYFFISIFLASTGIIAFFASNSFIFSPAKDIYDYSRINLKELPDMSWTIAWNVSGNPVVTRDPNQNEHQICSDGAGGAIVVWEEFNDPVEDNIYAQRIDSNGEIKWISAGIPICLVDDFQVEPQICSDGVGGAIIVWRDLRNGNYDIFAQRIDSDGNIQWDTNGVPVCLQDYTQSYHQICSDGAEGAIITWRDGRPGSDIYAQRVNSEGDILWTPVDGVQLCSDAYADSFPQICSDGAGGAIIGWTKNLGGGNYDVYAQRINPNGFIQWGTNGVAICTESNAQDDLDLLNNEIGGAIITWEDWRSLDPDIYGQMIDSNGNIMWENNGTEICKVTGVNLRPKISGDLEGGAIITWEDYRNILGNRDIYAQRIGSDGVIEWATNGIAICNTNDTQEFQEICSDGGGGAIITWQDGRGVGMNIFAQRISSEGNLKWTTNGVMITNITGGQVNPLITSDGLGGAIIAWQDDRDDSDVDIYAQRIINDAPTSNHPEDIKTDSEGSEEINWTLTDDSAGGKYRILANNTNGDYYTAVNWTSWTSGNEILVSIDRENVGEFNYTIQYYDDQNRFGVPDTVIVHITKEGFKISGYNLFFIVLSFFAIAHILTKKLKLRQKNQ